MCTYLGKTVTNQNFIQKEIKRRLNSGNACYHLVSNLLSSLLLSKNVNIYKTIILSVVLYGCETLFLRAFEKRVLRRIFGPKRNEETGGWRKMHYKELHDLYSSPSVIRTVKPRRLR
jgi:hypothetical protein